MIVKVQASIFTTEPLGPQALVYDKHRKFEWQGPLPASVKDILAGRPKAFFLAHIDEQRQLVLGEEAQWQSW